MKEKELRACAVCAVCGNKIGKTGLPMFWRVRIERHGIDFGAVRRAQGLADMMNGSMALAQAMGPDEEMTVPMMDAVNLTVCENCCTKQVCVAELAERGAAKVTEGIGASPRTSQPLCSVCGSELTIPPSRYGMSESGESRCYCPKCNFIYAGSRASKTEKETEGTAGGE